MSGQFNQRFGNEAYLSQVCSATVDKEAEIKPLVWGF
jgi:hypothetical protein